MKLRNHKPQCAEKPSKQVFCEKKAFEILLNQQLEHPCLINTLSTYIYIYILSCIINRHNTTYSNSSNHSRTTNINVLNPILEASSTGSSNFIIKRIQVDNHHIKCTQKTKESHNCKKPQQIWNLEDTLLKGSKLETRKVWRLD